jgi:hypothetical protein
MQEGLDTHTTITEILFAQISELILKMVVSYYKQLFSLGLDHKHKMIVLMSALQCWTYNFSYQEASTRHRCPWPGVVIAHDREAESAVVVHGKGGGCPDVLTTASGGQRHGCR